jgi:hypothetical protein
MATLNETFEDDLDNVFLTDDFAEDVTFTPYDDDATAGTPISISAVVHDYQDQIQDNEGRTVIVSDVVALIKTSAIVDEISRRPRAEDRMTISSKEYVCTMARFDVVGCRLSLVRSDRRGRGVKR